MAGAGPMVADLRAESDDLDALVAPLAAERWAEPTPAPGWTIAHQIGHLLWTDRVALLSVTDEAGFADAVTQAMANPIGFVDAAAEELAGHCAGRIARRLAAHPRTPARRTAQGSRRSQVALVRPADERTVDGHRAADGDLGTWP